MYFSGRIPTTMGLYVYLLLVIVCYYVVAIDFCPIHSDSVFPSIDGQCRHLRGPSTRFGGSNRPVTRLAGQAVYADGTDTPADAGLPSARVVSNRLLADGLPSPKSVNDGSLLLIYFGQFIDHDITLVEVFNATTDFHERFDIAIPRGDRHLGNTEFIPFGRSKFDRDDAGVRQFRNVQTPWLDLSQVYGATDDVNRRLRAHDGTGRMLSRFIDGHEVLPLNRHVGVTLEQDSAQAFACGDIRCNEHTVLLSLTTLFMREHNRLCREYASQHPAASDEDVFQHARLRNIQAYQAIVYEEWLPKLLGANNLAKLLGPYQGYSPQVDPSTNELFRLAAFRFGHSGVLNSIALVDASDRPVTSLPGTRSDMVDRNGHVRVSKVFFRPDLFFSTRGTLMDLCLNGVQLQTHNKIDVRIANVLRNELFREVPGSVPLDLPAMNIQRARDHGLAPFDAERLGLGLKPLRCRRSVSCVTEFTGDEELAQRILAVYGDMDRVDAFVAGLAEKRFGDGQLGQTWTVVIADQFRRMRDGDRFHYAAAKAPVTKLHQVLNRNLKGGRRAHNVFEAAADSTEATDTQSIDEASFDIAELSTFA